MTSLRDVGPSAITLMGLLLAVHSLIASHEGRYGAAAWLVLLAACTDTVDGGLARRLGTVSPFGQQLDSLVDLVAAGVAPGFLVYRAHFESWGAWGAVPAFAWVALVAVRLARFNTAQVRDPLHFVGIPCPIAAAALCQYLVFSRGTWGHDGHWWMSAALILGLGALMLSDVPYWKSGTLLPREFFHHPVGPGVVVMAVLAVPFPHQAVFVIVTASIAYNAARHARCAIPRLAHVRPALLEE